MIIDRMARTVPILSSIAWALPLGWVLRTTTAEGLRELRLARETGEAAAGTDAEASSIVPAPGVSVLRR